MRRVQWITFLILITASVALSQTRYVTVISITANLRGTPNIDAPIVREVSQGQTFKPLEERGKVGISLRLRNMSDGFMEIRSGSLPM